MAVTKLTDGQRTFSVQSLACFDSPGVVAEALRKEFGVKIAPQSVEQYDPTKRAGANCAARFRERYLRARARPGSDSGICKTGRGGGPCPAADLPAKLCQPYERAVIGLTPVRTVRAPLPDLLATDRHRSRHWGRPDRVGSTRAQTPRALANGRRHHRRVEPQGRRRLR